jgi:hypothetical protein
MGSMLANLVGADLTGTDHLALFPEALRADFVRRHRRLVAHPCGMYSTAHGSTLKGRDLSMEGIALPLARDNGGHCVARVIKVLNAHHLGDRMAAVTPSAPQPRWIDLGAGVPE